MKKTLAFILVIALIMSLGIVPAFAATYEYDVAGIITSDATGNVTGSLTATPGNLTFVVTGQCLPGEPVPFTATITDAGSGNKIGDLTNGLINTSGIDTLTGVFTYTNGTVGRILGYFPQSGVDGDFKGQITFVPLVNPVTSISFGGGDTVNVGSSLQMTAQTLPAEASDDVLWSVHVEDKDYATIDMNTGLLIGLKAGAATVIAKAADGSLVGAEKEITVVDPRTEVTAAVEPSYIVVIPPSVDFGVLQKDTGTKEKPFPVEAKNLVLEQNCCIDVKVSSINSMNDGYGNQLAYTLENNVPSVITTGTFTTFFVPRTETGSVSVDTAAITKAGAYKGTMTFNISYVKAP